MKHAFQSAAIALQTQVLLARRENNFLGRLRFDFANFNIISCSDTGIGALQAIKPDKIQPFIFRIGQDSPRRGCLFTENFDNIALDQSQFAQIVPDSRASPRPLSSGRALAT